MIARSEKAAYHASNQTKWQWHDAHYLENSLAEFVSASCSNAEVLPVQLFETTPEHAVGAHAYDIRDSRQDVWH